MRLVGDLQGENRVAAIAALFSEWSAVNPLRAVQAAGQLADPGEQNRALREVLGQWMDREPEAAIAWARQRPPDPPPAGILSSPIAEIRPFKTKLLEMVSRIAAPPNPPPDPVLVFVPPPLRPEAVGVSWVLSIPNPPKPLVMELPPAPPCPPPE